MTQVVQVPGVGTLQFPDGMSQADMAAAIQKNFPQIHGPNAPTPQQGAMAAASPGYAKGLFGETEPVDNTSFMDAIVNPALATGAHALGTLVDVATGTGPGAGSHAERFAAPFQPTGQMPAEVADAKRAEAINGGISNAYDAVAGTGPLAQTLKERIPQAAEAIGAVTGAGGALDSALAARAASRAAIPTAQEVVDNMAAASPQSQGAAAAAPRVSAASPELQQAIVRTAQQNGGAVDPAALSRHLEADSLPVKVPLTPGQATQDPVRISQEMNSRAGIEGLPELLRHQNQALTENIQAIRDEGGPDVFSTNATEHGDALISAYKAKNDAAQAAIDAKYKALRDANGGDFPVDAKTLYANASAGLQQQLLFEHAPSGPMAQLARLADSGDMTLGQFESLRTNLARIQRTATDGNERAAAGVIRDAMEQLPLEPDAAHLKALADDARGAARQQFQALDADPAYKAAVNDTVPPDRFINRFVVNAPRDDVASMRANLADNPTAAQTMSVATLDHLRNAATGGTPDGAFSAARFTKALQALDPKLQALVDPKTAEQLATLGNVARYTQAQPRGSFVNNSNTLVGLLSNQGANVAEHLLNAKTVIGGTLVRKALQSREAAQFARETLTPYGGLEPKATTPVEAMLAAARRRATQQATPPP